MRARTKFLRTVTALGSGVLLLAASAGATTARTELFTIEIDLDTDTETVKSDGSLLCAEGDAITDFHRAAGNFDPAETPPRQADRLRRRNVRDQGRRRVELREGRRNEWGLDVVPGSGTGDFEGLGGGGTVVGINSDEAPITWWTTTSARSGSDSAPSSLGGAGCPTQPHVG